MIMKNDFLKNSTIAHRGIYDNKKIIENTIEAFKKAISKGYTIELDLRLTKDNRVVVFHDEDLSRLGNRKDKINNLTLEELRKVKLLNKSNIPTFDEVLCLVDCKVPLLVELKPDKGFNLEKLVSRQLDNYKGKYAIQSFDPRTILWFRLFRKNVTRGLLISPKMYKPRLIKTCSPDFINVNKTLLDDKVIKNFKGIKLAYTIKKDEKDKYSDKCDNMICDI